VPNYTKGAGLDSCHCISSRADGLPFAQCPVGRRAEGRCFAEPEITQHMHSRRSPNGQLTQPCPIRLGWLFRPIRTGTNGEGCKGGSTYAPVEGSLTILADQGLLKVNSMLPEGALLPSRSLWLCMVAKSDDPLTPSRCPRSPSGSTSSEASASRVVFETGSETAFGRESQQGSWRRPKSDAFWKMRRPCLANVTWLFLPAVRRILIAENPFYTLA